MPSFSSKPVKNFSTFKIFALVLLLALLSIIALYLNGGDLQGRFGQTSILEIME